MWKNIVFDSVSGFFAWPRGFALRFGGIPIVLARGSGREVRMKEC